MENRIQNPLSMIEIPSELIKAINENNLVIFVGAGQSYEFINNKGVQFKGWLNLVEQLVKYLDDQGFDVDEYKKQIQHIKQPLSNKPKIEPIDILTSIENNNEFPIQKLRDLAQRFYSLSKDSQLDLHKDLFRLSNIIITTNYDQAFEIANPDAETVLIGKNNSILLFDTKTTFVVFKLHGCVSQSDTMVLFPSDYDYLYNYRIRHDENKEKARILLSIQKIIANKTVLFMGCGMGDFQINQMFFNIKNILKSYNQPHFIITSNKLEKKLEEFLKPIYINDYKEIPQIIKKLLVIKNEYSSHLGRQLENVTKDYEKESDVSIKKALKMSMEGLRFHLEKNYEKAIEFYEKASELIPEGYASYLNWGLALCELASIKKDKHLYEKSIDITNKAIDLKPKDDYAYVNLGKAFSELAEMIDDDNMIIEAIQIYQYASLLNTKNGEAYYNLGLLFYKLGKKYFKFSLFEKSLENYQYAVNIIVGNDKIYENWANALCEFGKLQENGYSYFKDSIEKSSIAVELNPQNYSALTNWGNALSELGEITKDIQLLEESIKKYETATILNKDDDARFNNWGVAYYRLSKIQNNIGLLEKSSNCYRIATEINPNNDAAYTNWGVALYYLGDFFADRNLLLESVEKYNRAIQINPNNKGAKYNLDLVLAIL